MRDPDPATTAAEDAAVLAAWHDYVREGWLQEGHWRTIRNDRVLRSELVFGAFCTAWTKARAAERQRIYDELGRDHYVIFTPDRWTVEHSVECRLSGHMHECTYHAAVVLVADDGPDPGLLGRWRIIGIDSEGLPSLERADLLDGDTP